MNARLVSRERRGFKPRAGARLNWAHPLARGLVLCAPYNEAGGVAPRDLSRSPTTGFFYGSGVLWTPSPVGPALVQTGASGSAVSFGNPVKLQFGDASSFTIFSIIGPAGSGTTRCILGNDTFAAGRPLIQWNVTSAEKLGLTVGDVDFVLGGVVGATSIPVNSGRLFSAAGVRDVTADLLSVYLDGVLDGAVADDSTGTWAVTAGEWRSAYNAAGGAASNNWNGRKVLDLIWNRALSAIEIGQLHADPWQLFLSDGMLESDVFSPPPPNIFARAALPVELLESVAVRPALPVEFQGPITLTSSPSVPFETFGWVTADGLVPIEWRVSIKCSFSLPIEHSGLDPFTLPVTWRVIHRLNNDFPLLVTWGVIANPLQNATLPVTWQVRSVPLALAIRWTILPGAPGGPFPSDTPAPIVSSFTDADIHQPVATASKTP